jgi:hypothetical protein
MAGLMSVHALNASVSTGFARAVVMALHTVTMAYLWQLRGKCVHASARIM